MKDGRVDLHVHSSNSSDGDFAPSDLLRMAKEKGLRAISIADHDTVEAYPEAIEWSLEVGVELIPSVELTTRFPRTGNSISCCPSSAATARAVKAILGSISEARMEEAKERVARLQELGFDIGWDE